MLLAASVTSCAATSTRRDPVHPTGPAPGEAPALAPLPAGLPYPLELEVDADLVIDGFPRERLQAGDVVLPHALAQAVAEQRAAAAQLGPRCQVELDGLHTAWRSYTDDAIATERADKAAAVAEERAEVEPVPWWGWGLGGVAVGAVITVILTTVSVLAP